jgi:hypothetical protein
MKVTITVKEVNPEFDQHLADKEFNGKESEENILYTWEDEFDINGDVREFKIRNNVSYDLQASVNDKIVTYPIEAVTIVDCITNNNTTTSCVFSRSIVKDTKKVVHKNGNIHFFVFLKGGKEIVSPVTGIYINKKDWPKQLPLPPEEDITGDEEE